MDMSGGSVTRLVDVSCGRYQGNGPPCIRCWKKILKHEVVARFLEGRLRLEFCSGF